MKQITNKEYEEWQKYKAEKAKGHVLLPDTVRFICEANGYDAEKIGQHFLEILPKITEQGGQQSRIAAELYNFAVINVFACKLFFFKIH